MGTTLINKTDEDMEIRVSSEIIPGRNDVIKKNYVIEAGQQINIDGRKYGSQGEVLHTVMIFSDDFLRSRLTQKDSVFRGEYFFSFKTVTIGQGQEDQNSTGVVNYEVKFEQPRQKSGNATTYEVFSNSVLKHDNGWSVQHRKNGSVKLTRKEGMTMTLDPSKLFATVVDRTETSLMRVVLKFWPRTFADLNCKDDLGTTISIVNYLMRQAKDCHDDESKVKDDEVVKKVVKKVDDLHESCAAMVEWYRPLFPKMKDRFREVDPEKLKKFEEKLNKFETTIKPMLQRTAESHD